MKERTKAYLAGLLDADGHCTIVKSTLPNGSEVFSCRLGIANTYRPVIKWITHHFGGSYRTDFRNRLTTLYLWSPQSRSHTEKILSAILPYLMLKKRQATEVFALCSLRGVWQPETRRAAFQRVREYQSGSVTTDSPSFPKRNLANAYFAGFFDGEGTIAVSHKADGYVLTVRVGCTAESVVRGMQQHYGGRISAYESGWSKTVFYWDCGNHATQEQFLLCVLPYLLIKREQARLALQIVRLHHRKDPALRETLFLEMRRLKTIGKKIQSELAGDGESAPAETPAA